MTPRVCFTRAPTEPPKTTTFVEVEETQLDGKEKRIFSGWMFADSPGLNAVEHPVFDVWLTDCAQPRASAQRAAAGRRTARGRARARARRPRPAAPAPRAAVKVFDPRALHARSRPALQLRTALYSSWGSEGRARWCGSSLLLLLLVLVPSVAHAEKRIALLIGNQGYGSEIGRLANPHNDIALLEKP